MKRFQNKRKLKSIHIFILILLFFSVSFLTFVNLIKVGIKKQLKFLLKRFFWKKKISKLFFSFIDLILWIKRIILNILFCGLWLIVLLFRTVQIKKGKKIQHFMFFVYYFNANPIMKSKDNHDNIQISILFMQCNFSLLQRHFSFSVFG